MAKEIKDKQKVVGIKEASKIFGVSEWVLRQGVKQGKYPYSRIGGANGKIVFIINDPLECIPVKTGLEKYGLTPDDFEDPDFEYVFGNINFLHSGT